jgi:hypothetical protein
MRARVRIASTFERNLNSIREFFTEQESAGEFDSLITCLFGNVIPNLKRFPKMGRDFLGRNPLSEEGRAKLHSLKMKSGKDTEIREYVAGECLLLFAVRDSVVTLLAIRHHRQLSFDLRAHWF